MIMVSHPRQVARLEAEYWMQKSDKLMPLFCFLFVDFFSDLGVALAEEPPGK